MERGSNCFLGRVRTSISKEAYGGGSNCFLTRVRTNISKEAYGAGFQSLLGEGLYQ